MGQIYPPPKFDGTRINVEDSPVALAIDSSTYVIHGWDQVAWKTCTKEKQRDFLENLTFELYIDGERVERARRPTNDESTITVTFYAP